MSRTPAAVLVLLVFTLLVALPGIGTIPPLDRDEPRFTQASRQMLDTGDFVDIRFQEEARHKKPAGIYWLQSASVGLIGGDRTAIWKYRIISALGIISAVLLTFWVSRSFLSREQSFYAALLLGSTILVGVEAHIAKTDSVLLACIVGAQGVLARLWLNRSPHGFWFAMIFWVCLGAGILIKGPIILLVCGGTMAALSVWDRNVRWLARLRPLRGLLVMLAIAVPWYVAIGLRTDGAFFQEALGKDFLGKIASGQESHGAPPGLHTIVMVATFWPASAFLIALLPNVRRALGRPAVKFALCWAVPTWLVFELTATKLPHYVLPVFPALVLLIVALFEDAAKRPQKLWLVKLTALWLAIVPIAIFAGSVVVPLLLKDSVIWSATILLAGAAGIGILAAADMKRGNYHKSSIYAAIAVTLVSFGAYGLALPQLSSLWVSSELVYAAKRGSKCPDPRIVSVGWREPSLIFLGGTETILTSAAGAVGAVLETPCSVLAVEGRHQDQFVSSSQNGDNQFVEIGVVTGFALNGGDDIRITLYQKTGPL